MLKIILLAILNLASLAFGVFSIFMLMVVYNGYIKAPPSFYFFFILIVGFFLGISAIGSFIIVKKI